jgi:uncharacterized membrane protein
MEPVCQFLQKHDYTLPLHPPLTHLPTGLIVAAFLMLVVAIIFKRESFLITARHCIILAFIFFFPAVFLGFTDWYHFFTGAMIFPIKVKIVLSGALLVLLAAAVIVEIKRIGGPMIRLVIYLLCLVAVVRIEHYGGQIVFCGESSAASSGDVAKGEKLYIANCGGCHPNGGNAINSQFPVVGSPQLKSESAFTNFNRNPVRPDGSKGMMPAFPKEKISDQDMGYIYEYVTKGLKGK